MSTGFKELRAGVTAPAGFLASGLSAGIKSSFFKKMSKQPKDLALVCSTTPAIAVGAFTSNTCKAAPVLVSMKHIRRGIAQAIVINSGNANCATGAQGLQDAYAMGEETARALGIPEDSVLVSSTGTIGKRLPIDKIKKAIPVLAKKISRESSRDAAEAILTTDTKIKEKAVEFICGGKKVRIGAFAKGAGMIAPQLKTATMLCVIATDVHIQKDALRKAFDDAIEVSFNAISIDGCMSTNDMVVCLANAHAGNDIVDLRSRDFRVCADALAYVMKALAAMIVEDGEGVEKILSIEVKNAASPWQAREVARSLGNYLLFKVMLNKELPNWGRVIAGIGQAHTAIDPQKLDVFFCGHKIIERGVCVAAKETSLKKSYAQKKVSMQIYLQAGKHEFTFLTTDISAHYLKINTTYG